MSYVHQANARGGRSKHFLANTTPLRFDLQKKTYENPEPLAHFECKKINIAFQTPERAFIYPHKSKLFDAVRTFYQYDTTFSRIARSFRNQLLVVRLILRNSVYGAVTHVLH